MSDPVEFITEYCDFDIDPYILMAVGRRKHNDDVTHNTEPIYREVVHDTDRAERAYHDIRVRCDRRPYEWRVYLSTNARDVQTAYFNFRDRMNSWSRRLVEGDDEVTGKFGNVDSEWISELHRPPSAATSLFTFDLDDVSAVDAGVFADALPRGCHTVRESPNGFHVVADPFEYPDWDPPVEYDDLDTDGHVHVTRIVGEENGENSHPKSSDVSK